MRWSAGDAYHGRARSAYPLRVPAHNSLTYPAGYALTRGTSGVPLRREVQRGDAEIASCTMAAATAAAPMSRRVFTADTSLAASLYTGCATSHLASNATSMLRPPTVLLIGSLDDEPQPGGLLIAQLQQRDDRFK